MSKLELPEIPPEMAHQALLGMFKDYVAAFMQALTDKFGSEEALKLIRPYFVEVGKRSTEAALPLLGIEGKDAIAIGTIIRLSEDKILKVEGRETLVSPDKLVTEDTKCVFQECKPEVCQIFQFAGEGTIQAINPEYEFRLTKTMTEGNKVCEWVIEKKK